MSRTISSRSRAAARERNLCQFPFNDGRRCRMLRYPGHPCLCVFHARAEAQLLETARLGGELSQTVSGDFMTATDINHALGRLYTAVAEDRIPIRNANTLARIGSTMLRTVPTIKTEFPFSYTFEQWQERLRTREPLSMPAPPAPSLPPPPAPPSAQLVTTRTSAVTRRSAKRKSKPTSAPTLPQAPAAPSSPATVTE